MTFLGRLNGRGPLVTRLGPDGSEQRQFLQCPPVITSIGPCVLTVSLRVRSESGGRHRPFDERRKDQSGSRSLPLRERSGSVHPARLKQHGRRLPCCIFEMVTSTRRLRVSGFRVSLTQRTHSQRAIGVMSFHISLIVSGAAARADFRSCGTLGSGHSSTRSSSTVAVSPARAAASR